MGWRSSMKFCLLYIEKEMNNLIIQFEGAIVLRFFSSLQLVPFHPFVSSNQRLVIEQRAVSIELDHLFIRQQPLVRDCFSGFALLSIQDVIEQGETAVLLSRVAGRPSCDRKAMGADEVKDSLKEMDWKTLGSDATNNKQSSSGMPATKRLPKKIRQIPDYYFLPRKSLPSAMVFYGSFIAAGIGAGMLLEGWIDKKVKEDGGVIWEFK